MTLQQGRHRVGVLLKLVEVFDRTEGFVDRREDGDAVRVRQGFAETRRGRCLQESVQIAVRAGRLDDVHARWRHVSAGRVGCGLIGHRLGGVVTGWRAGGERESRNAGECD